MLVVILQLRASQNTIDGYSRLPCVASQNSPL
jgi:hypothetical protein